MKSRTMKSRSLRIDMAFLDALRKAYPTYPGDDRSLVEMAIGVAIEVKTGGVLISSPNEKCEPQSPPLPVQDEVIEIVEVVEEATDRDEPANDDEVDE